MSGSIQIHCPRCTSDKIFESRRRGFFDNRILPFTGMRPYRCAACQHRYYRRTESVNLREAPVSVPEEGSRPLSQ